MDSLNDAQTVAIDSAKGYPACLNDAGTGQGTVFLRTEDFEWIRGLLGDEPDAPLRIHPLTGQSYALVPAERYERFRAFFEEVPLTPEERTELLREAGRRAGWDDPAFDIYNQKTT
jgi:hypothetical protein